jgi:hypothetical protein
MEDVAASPLSLVVLLVLAKGKAKAEREAGGGVENRKATLLVRKGSVRARVGDTIE